MKLVRFGDVGAEKPGLMDGDILRDLSGHLDDITGATLDNATLNRLRAIGGYRNEAAICCISKCLFLGEFWRRQSVKSLILLILVLRGFDLMPFVAFLPHSVPDFCAAQGRR